jgi:hypothetical protein
MAAQPLLPPIPRLLPPHFLPPLPFLLLLPLPFLPPLLLILLLLPSLLPFPPFSIFLPYRRLSIKCMPLTGLQRESRQHEHSTRAKSHGKTMHNRTSDQQNIITNAILAASTTLTEIIAPTANSI